MTVPSPLIVLCAPRSFSSVTVAMLGGHPELYAFPELNLFIADTLGELVDWDGEAIPERAYTTGLRRAIAQLEFGEQNEETLEAARHWLAEHRQWSTGRMFHWLARRVAPRRLVDKSPRTAMARSSCRRLFATAPQGRYLHLTRHPAASIRSLASTVAERGPHVNRFFALIWLECQQTVLDFMAALHDKQCLRVRGEDLLNNPESALREVALWLGLSAGCDEIRQMRCPQQWPFARYVAGAHGADVDSGFLANPSLRGSGSVPTVEELWALDLGEALTKRIIQVDRNLAYA